MTSCILAVGRTLINENVYDASGANLFSTRRTSFSPTYSRPALLEAVRSTPFVVVPDLSYRLRLFLICNRLNVLFHSTKTTMSRLTFQFPFFLFIFHSIHYRFRVLWIYTMMKESDEFQGSLTKIQWTVRKKEYLGSYFK